MMRRTAWIWAVGCAAWAVDGVVCLRYPNKQHAQLAFLMAMLFGVAWLFYRQQRR
jgi:uncharacterized membrane protein YfcA